MQHSPNSSEHPRHYGSDFARRRSGVRIPPAPLLKSAHLQVKLKIKTSSPIASQALVQQPCSNAEGRMRRHDQRRSGVQAPRPTTLVKASHTTPNAKTNTPKYRGLAARAITEASRPAARARKFVARSGSFSETGLWRSCGLSETDARRLLRRHERPRARGVGR